LLTRGSLLTGVSALAITLAGFSPAWAVSCSNGAAVSIDTVNCTVQSGTVPSTVTFANGATGELLLNGASPTGAIDATTANQGTIVVQSNTTLSPGATIGAVTPVGSIVINPNTTLDASGVSTIGADSISVGPGNGVLVLGNTTVNVTSGLDGAGGPGNTIHVTGNASINGDVGQGAGIDTKIDDGASLTASGNYRSGVLLGNTANSDATLTLGGTSLLVGAVNGNSLNATGRLVINGAITANAGIGTLFSLNSVTINSGESLNLATFNQSLAASSIVLNTGSTLFAGVGGITGNISGAGSLSKQNAGTLTLNGSNNYTGGTTVSAGILQGDSSSLQGAITNNAAIVFDQASNGTFTGNISGAGSLTKQNAGTLMLNGGNSYTGGTMVSAGILQGDSSSLQGAITNNAAIVFNQTSNGTFTGSISGAGSITKLGSGVLFLGGDSSGITGTTTIAAGTLEVGSASPTSTLGGNVAVNSGGGFAPGNGTAGSSINVSGNLALQSGAAYLTQVDVSTASVAHVAGTATLGGATVNANFASGSYVAKQYTILTATGGVSGTFGSLVTINLPTNLHTALSYDANDAYLNLALSFAIPSGLNNNQQRVGNALTNFFNATGGIPAAYSTLTPAGLAQASGEIATGAQQTTFDAMTQFMGVMTDPFVAGRGDPVASSSAGAPQFADEESASAYAAAGRTGSAAERDAYAAIYRKAPVAVDNATQRWSVWAAGFGGSQTTDGKATLGSDTATSRVFGTAVGADYRFSPDTLAGFALAGGGTNFSVANSGFGRSDLFQAGAFVRHMVGMAYLSGALAYGWQDITTNRTVTIAGSDQLQGRFNANAYSARVESGYRFMTPWMGLTPYAAGQFTTFELPAYAESALAGNSAFALNYGSHSVTDSRSEFGLRADKSIALTNAVLTLRGRAAWAHDFNPDRVIAATFQALPGASFAVNGATQAHDSALTTASAELKWPNGFSLAATFEGEFSNVTRSYAGKSVVRYAW
jgi:autotransporter-associated beta strand protein